MRWVCQGYERHVCSGSSMEWLTLSTKESISKCAPLFFKLSCISLCLLKIFFEHLTVVYIQDTVHLLGKSHVGKSLFFAEE